MKISKKEKSRSTIMHGAKVLFELEGLEHVTFSDIADQVGMSRSTVFNHFANTEELLEAIYQQEITDILEHCEKTALTGIAFIKELFDKLIEDTAFYPVLVTRLTHSSILGSGQQKAISIVEEIVSDNLPKDSDEEKMILIMGAYYGLVNHYHSNNKKFDVAEMKEKFHSMVDMIIGGDNR